MDEVRKQVVAEALDLMNNAPATPHGFAEATLALIIMRIATGTPLSNEDIELIGGALEAGAEVMMFRTSMGD